MSSDDEMSGGGTDRADGIARLLRAAGRRDGPPPGSYDRTLQAARAVWLASQRQRQRRRRRWRLAAVAAACTTLATVAVWQLQRPDSAAQVVANLDRSIGVVQARPARRGDWSALKPSAPQVVAGSLLRTAAAGRAAVRLNDGASVRLDHATEIEFLSARALRLVSGRIYVDTGADTAGPGLRVETAAGTVRDVGTQFEVLFGAGTYRIRVREGQVLAQEPGGLTITGSAGDELLSRRGGRFERSTIDVRDRGWTWIESVAMPPPTNDQPMSVVLAWVARETGRRIRFESAALERRATRAVLHGTIPQLAPLETLRVTLASLDLEYTLTEDGAILIRSRALTP